MTAESNVLEGDNVICLGCFEQGRHSTLAQTPALRHWQLFLPVACSVARAQLDLPYAQYPLTPAEDAGIAAIPIVLSEGPLDEAAMHYMTQLAGAIVSSQIGMHAV